MKADPRLLRLPQVLELYPIGKTLWYEGVKSGRYPAPIKLSSRVVAWRRADIVALIERTVGTPEATRENNEHET